MSTTIADKFANLPASLQTLASNLILTRATQDAKANYADLVAEVVNIFAEPLAGVQTGGAGSVGTTSDDAGEDTGAKGKTQTAAQKKKAAAADAKKKPAGKKDKKPEIDLTPFKEQVGDFLEWLGSDKEDEIAKILEEFGAETADDVADENYTEFYKLVRELASEEFDLSEVEDLLAA